VTRRRPPPTCTRPRRCSAPYNCPGGASTSRSSRVSLVSPAQRRSTDAIPSRRRCRPLPPHQNISFASAKYQLFVRFLRCPHRTFGGRCARWGTRRTQRATPSDREEASTQQIQLGAAEPLALQHLQSVDVPLDRTVTPRQADPGLDGGRVLP
jgi:hypothetical protein